MAKHPKTNQQKEQAKKHSEQASKKESVGHVGTTPNSQATTNPKRHTNETDNPPTPTQMSNFGLNREKAKITDWLVVALTLLVAIAAFWSAWIFQGQLAEMHKATEIQERPWLSVEAQPVNGLSWVNGQQPVLVLKFAIKNVGHSIAKSSQLDVKMFPTSVGMPVAVDAIQHQRELCDHPKISPMQAFDLFPVDQPAERQVDISAPTSTVAAQAVAVTSDKPRKFIGFYVVGCVTYRFSFGPNFHQNRFAYHLLSPALKSEDGNPPILPNGTPLLTGFEIGVNVPKDQLGIIQELFALNDAN
ncbi:MAG TPA: hypothetical protein VH351_20640 [Bryobacteraceae bacterium]|nr:hypothetical protein [Bryobacteraceae bacterium]